MTDLDVSVPLADALTGRASIQLPDRTPAPVVVLRTMYDRANHAAEGRAWATRGYAFIAADVRGRYSSEGAMTPYRNERADGAALLDWLLDQPWCNGTIVAYGGSYAAYTAWCLAVARPDAVRVVISLSPTLELATTKFDRSGILRLAEHAGWWLAHGDTRESRPGLPGRVWAEHPELVDTLPLSTFPERSGLSLPGWWPVAAEGGSHAAPERVTDDELADLRVASFHAAGWYDVAVDEALRLHDLVGLNHQPRPVRRLVIGPWEHDLGATGTRVGERDHGPASRFHWGSEYVAWLDEVLTGGPAPDRSEAFLMGAGHWRSWPVPTRPVRMYPQPDGTLSQHAGPPGRTGFIHEPLDPFPSVRAGFDRRETRARSDAARFAAAPLEQPIDIAGTTTARLTAVAGKSADWVIRLLEQSPAGGLVELTRGVGQSPEGEHVLAVDLDPFAARVAAGHQLVLEVAGSDFPRLARNLGTGHHRLTGQRTAPVAQLVRAGADSWVDLPVVVAA